MFISFISVQNIGAYGGKDINWNNAEKENIIQFLSEVEFDDYDKLIQLSDSLGNAVSVNPAASRPTAVNQLH